MLTTKIICARWIWFGCAAHITDSDTRPLSKELHSNTLFDAKGRREMNATIEFKAKVKRTHYSDGSGYDYVQIPEFDRKHCDMNAFRSHPKYGSYANSDLFKGMLRRIRTERFGNSLLLKLNEIPDGVQVNTSGFLAVVTISV